MKKNKVTPEFRANWIKVHSSNLSAIKYDSKNQVLYVKFVEGHIYRYEGVEEELYKDILEPGVSVGKLFATTIRNKGYKATQLTETRDITVFTITEEEIT